MSDFRANGVNRRRFHLHRVRAGFVAQFLLFGDGRGDAVGAKEFCGFGAGGEQLTSGLADSGLWTSKTTSPSFKSGFSPPAKPQVKTKSGELVARKLRTDFSAFARPMPTMSVDTPGCLAAVFLNGAASSFKAKQMSVDISQTLPVCHSTALAAITLAGMAREFGQRLTWRQPAWCAPVSCARSCARRRPGRIARNSGRRCREWRSTRACSGRSKPPPRRPCHPPAW